MFWTRPQTLKPQTNSNNECRGPGVLTDKSVGSFLVRVSFGVLFIRVPYYIGDPNRDHNFENYPCIPTPIKEPNPEQLCVCVCVFVPPPLCSAAGVPTLFLDSRESTCFVQSKRSVV